MVSRVGAILESAAVRAPDHPALVCVEGQSRASYSYAQVQGSALTVCGALMTQGVHPGRRVALIAPNGLAFVAGFFGAMHAGAVVVPISSRIPLERLVERLKRADVCCIMHAREYGGIAHTLVDAMDGACTTLSLEHVLSTGDGGSIKPASATTERAAMLLYTSGTTASSRGALISHQTLFSHTRSLGDRVLGLTPDDRVMGVLPLSHSFGCRMVMLVTFYVGATAVLMEGFSAEESLRTMADEGVTWLPGVPTMFSAWSRVTGGRAPSSLRWCLSAGAPLAEAIRSAAEQRLGADVRQGYGLTEATFSTINAPPDSRMPGMVGLPVPGVALRIATKDGSDAPQGGLGEVLVRGPHLMMGYLDDPAGTAAAFSDGWLKTGDLGRLDAHGRLEVVERIKDLIIRSGHNIVPAELERALVAHPGVAEAAVVGRADPHRGEEIVAVLVPSVGSPPSVEELDAWICSRVGRAQRPREYAWTEALPLGPSRKVLKRQLREALSANTMNTVAVDDISAGSG